MRNVSKEPRDAFEYYCRQPSEKRETTARYVFLRLLLEVRKAFLKRHLFFFFLASFRRWQAKNGSTQKVPKKAPNDENISL